MRDQFVERRLPSADQLPHFDLLDYPARPNMLGVDIMLATREGKTERLTGEGRAGQLGLPRIADELYRSARHLRIFTAEPKW